MISSLIGGDADADIERFASAAPRRTRRNLQEEDDEEGDGIPVLTRGLKYNQEQLGIVRFETNVSREGEKDFSGDIEVIQLTIRSFEGYPPPLLEDDEAEKEEKRESIMSSTRPFEPWKEDYEGHVDFEFSLEKICETDQKEILSSIISFCSLKQIISSLLFVNKSFYEASIHALLKIDLRTEDVKLLFGLRSCINENLFIKFLPTLGNRIRNIHLSDERRNESFRNSVLHFCLFHRFRKATELFLSLEDSHFSPRNQEILLTIRNFDDDLLLLLLKHGIEKSPYKPKISPKCIRCFTYKRNHEGLRYIRENYLMDMHYERGSDNFTEEQYFIDQILMNQEHSQENARVLKELSQFYFEGGRRRPRIRGLMNYRNLSDDQSHYFFSLDGYQNKFFQYLPFLPYDIVFFFVTTKPGSKKYFLINREIEYLVKGIEINLVMSREEKKYLVDMIFNYVPPPPNHHHHHQHQQQQQRRNPNTGTRRQQLLSDIRDRVLQLRNRIQEQQQDDDDEDESEGESDLSEEELEVVEEEIITEEPKEEERIEFFFKPEDAITKSYQFVYFYGREGYEEEFRKSLERLETTDTYFRLFEPKTSISEEFLKIAKESGKVVTVRPQDMLSSVDKNENFEFDLYFANFAYLKDKDNRIGVMDRDLDILVKYALKSANNHAFRKIMEEIEGYLPGKIPFEFSVRNENQVNVVRYLGRKYLEGSYGDENERKKRLSAMMNTLVYHQTSSGKNLYKTYVMEIMKDPFNTPQPQLIIHLESTIPELAKHYWEEMYSPKQMKDFINVLVPALSNRKREIVNRIFKNKMWNESFLVLVSALHRTDQNVRNLGLMFPTLRKFSIGCFTCGRKLMLFKKNNFWGTQLMTCTSCSPKWSDVLEMKLPVQPRELEKIYCFGCCVRTPPGGPARCRYCRIGMNQ